MDNVQQTPFVRIIQFRQRVLNTCRANVSTTITTRRRRAADLVFSVEVSPFLILVELLHEFRIQLQLIELVDEVHESNQLLDGQVHHRATLFTSSYDSESEHPAMWLRSNASIPFRAPNVTPETNARSRRCLRDLASHHSLIDLAASERSPRYTCITRVMKRDTTGKH